MSRPHTTVRHSVHQRWCFLCLHWSRKTFFSLQLNQILPRTLKEASEELADLFFTLFKRSLTFRISRNNEKLAHITSIFKQRDFLLPICYLPIRLTSIPCNIFERIIKIQIHYHLARNSLTETERYGFLTGKSCVNNLLLFEYKLKQGPNSGPVMDSIFYNFAKSFYKASHQSLVFKIQEYGITGDTLKWIESLLTLRGFHVRVFKDGYTGARLEPKIPGSSKIHNIWFISNTLGCPTRLRPRLISFHDLHKWSLRKHNTSVAPLSRPFENLEYRVKSTANECRCNQLMFWTLHDAPQSFEMRPRNYWQRIGVHIPFQNFDGFVFIWIKTPKALVWPSQETWSSHDTTTEATKSPNFFKRTLPEITKTELHTVYRQHIGPILKYGYLDTYAYSAYNKNQLESMAGSQETSLWVARNTVHE